MWIDCIILSYNIYYYLPINNIINKRPYIIIPDPCFISRYICFVYIIIFDEYSSQQYKGLNTKKYSVHTFKILCRISYNENTVVTEF